MLALAAASLEDAVPRWAFFGPATLLCMAAWLAALVWLRHPLAQDPAFVRVLGRFGLQRPPR